MFTRFYKYLSFRMFLISGLCSAIFALCFLGLYVRSSRSLDNDKKIHLAEYICRIIEPRLQIGAYRDVEDFLNATARSLEKNLAPLMILEVGDQPKTIGPRIDGATLVHSCAFSGLANVKVEFHFLVDDKPFSSLLGVYLFFMMLTSLVLFAIVLVALKVQMISSDLLRHLINSEFSEAGQSSSPPLYSGIIRTLNIDREILKDLKHQFTALKVIIENQNEKLIAKSKTDALITMASQVSHDIRSPLAAMNMVIGQLANIPEAQRLVIRNSVNRITDIANTLLAKSKEQKAEASGGPTKTETASMLQVELLPALVDSIVSEKRIQFRDKIGIEIEGDFKNSYGAFVKISTTEIKRTISNLVNNSVEAFPEAKGQVVISVCKNSDNVILSVKDNGKGMPPHILEKLGQIGVSHGKDGTQSGSGLGVYHAKATVEGSGGKFEVSSKEGLGTTFTMTFPAAPAPKWFVEKLLLSPDSFVISLDDDTSIHSIYKERFDSIKTDAFGIKHLTFTSGVEFKEWVVGHDAKSSRLYLVDFELLNQKHTGLELIEQLGIGQQAILVTSRYEEHAIRSKCESLGVRLIPKGMAGFVPMEIEKAKEIFDAILIDDDRDIIQMCWASAAEAAGKKFRAYTHPDEFFAEATNFDQNSPIYVDSNLGPGIKGEEVSKKIFAMGFKNIYLCTGYQASDFPEMPWIKKIVGKDPIF